MNVVHDVHKSSVVMMICMKVANQNISKYWCTDASQLTVRVRVGDGSQMGMFQKTE